VFHISILGGLELFLGG